MAKICFFSLYDELALGARQLSSVVEQRGHAVSLVFLKTGSSCRQPVPPLSQEYFEHGMDCKYNQSLQSYRLFIYNQTCNPLESDEMALFLAAIADQAPDVIGLTATSYVDDMVIGFLAAVRERFPNLPVIAGGYGPTFSPEHYLSQCDYVFVGECEQALPDFLDLLDAGEDPRGASNLVYREGERVVRTPMADAVRDLDALPFPTYRDEGLVLIDKNTILPGDPIKKSYYTMAGRGCPGKCTYCSTALIGGYYKEHGGKFPGRRLKSVDGVIKECLQAKRLGFNYIIFEDSYLLGRMSFMEELLSRYKEEVGLKFFAYLHYGQMANYPELLRMALDAGMNHSVCGVQHAGKPFAESVMGRNVSDEDIRTTAQMFIDNELMYNYDFITDIPVESEADFDNQLEQIKLYPFDPNYTRICISRLRNFPGTPLTRRIETSPKDPFSQISWLFKACCIVLRFLVKDDETFRGLRHNGFFQSHPSALLALLPRFWAERYIRDGKPCLIPEVDINQIIFEYYAIKAFQKPVIIWGLGGRYQLFKPMFAKTYIKTFVDNNPETWGSTVDGAQVIPPADLGRFKGMLVFVCSTWKQEIVEQIHRTYGPDAFQIP